ncbi:MAG: GNAT family N-acetyltransferase [Burkholderiales bacterium]|jgi:GNAT superfamily N-acetyltransferase|nr:GNAT family N-acetyltransferase [Burkholderiales bacterium]
MNPPIFITADQTLTADQYVALLRSNSLGARRPIDDLARITDMLRHANLIVTAWEGDVLIGAARCVTDFAYCCYISDLSVDDRHQKRGIGKQILSKIQTKLHPNAKLILLAAPDAATYYPHLGFTKHASAWVLSASADLLETKP